MVQRLTAKFWFRRRAIATRSAAREERGQTLMMAALIMPILLGMVALVIDVGFANAEKRQGQNAVDAAALAAAYALQDGYTPAQAQTLAREYTAGNGYDNAVAGVTVTVNVPPSSGPHIGDSNYAEVLIDYDAPEFFITALGQNNGVISSRAVAGLTTSASQAYALFANNSDCNNPDTLETSGNLTLVNGGVHSNGNVKVPGNNNDFIGGFTYNCSLTVSGNNNTFSPPASTGSVQPFPVSYTYAEICGQPGATLYTIDTDLLSIFGSIIPDGIYCSTGKLTISGGSGTSGNVTLAALGEINISGNSSSLTPYWNNVLLLTENSSSSAVDISGNSFAWEGLILAPNGRAKVQGETGSSLVGAILADTIQISGQGFSINAVDYGQGGPTFVALVE